MSNREGIDITKLKKDTKILLSTKNSVYELVIVDPEQKICTIEGGEHFKKLTPVIFRGSTWGGSQIKLGWIGFEMFMELFVLEKEKTITTSAVVNAKVTGPNKEFTYELDWTPSTLEEEIDEIKSKKD